MPRTITQRTELTLETDKFKRSAAGATSLIAGLITGGALTLATKYTAQFQDLESTLGAVYGSAARGTKVFDDINRLSTRTQFGIADLSNTFIKLRSNGIEPTERLLRTFTDAAAVTTDQIGSLNAITDLWSRTTAGGLGLEDLNRLADRGLPAFDILNEKLGLSRLEISSVGRTAEGAGTILAALAEGINERFGGATQDRLGNLSTLLSNLRIGVINLAVAFGKGLTGGLGLAITGSTDLLESLIPLARQIGTALGNALKATIPLFAVLQEHMDNIVKVAGLLIIVWGATGLLGVMNAMTGATIILIAAFTGLNLVTVKTFKQVLKIVPIFRAIGLAVSIVVLLFGFKGQGLGRIWTQVSAVLGVLTSRFDFLPGVLRKVWNAVKSVASIFFDFYKFIVGQYIKAIERTINLFISMTNAAISSYNAVARWIPGIEEVDKVTFNLRETAEGFLKDNPFTRLFDESAEAARAAAEAYDEPVKALARQQERINRITRTHNLSFGEPDDRPRPDGQVESIRRSFSSDAFDISQDAVNERMKAYESLRESLLSEEQLEIESHFNKLGALEDYYKDRGALDSNYFDTLMKLTVRHENNISKIRAKEVEQQLGVFRSGKFAELDLAGFTNKQLTSLALEGGREALDAVAQTNKRAFQLRKDLARAEIAVNTAVGVTRAFAEAGPIFGTILSGVIIATGAAQLAALENQQYTPARRNGGHANSGYPILSEPNHPEIFRPDGPGKIIPLEDLVNQQQSGGDVYEFNINTLDASGVRELLYEEKETIVELVREAKEERGGRL